MRIGAAELDSHADGVAATVTTKTYRLIVGLALLAIVMGLYATGPEYASGKGRCPTGYARAQFPEACADRTAAWDRVWLAVVGD